MLTMIGKRLMFAIPSLIGVVIVTFLLTRALPGDPAAPRVGRHHDPVHIDEPVISLPEPAEIDPRMVRILIEAEEEGLPLAHLRGEIGLAEQTLQPRRVQP